MWHSPYFVHQITLVHVRGKAREDQQWSRWTHGTFPWKSFLWSMAESPVYLLNSQWEVLGAGALKVGQERVERDVSSHPCKSADKRGVLPSTSQDSARSSQEEHCCLFYILDRTERRPFSGPWMFFFVFLRWSSLAGPPGSVPPQWI